MLCVNTKLTFINFNDENGEMICTSWKIEKNRQLGEDKKHKNKRT